MVALGALTGVPSEAATPGGRVHSERALDGHQALLSQIANEGAVEVAVSPGDMQTTVGKASLGAIEATWSYGNGETAPPSGDCGHHGTLRSPAGAPPKYGLADGIAGYCECSQGWSGGDCSEKVTADEACSGHGWLVKGAKLEAGRTNCECDFGYNGAACEHQREGGASRYPRVAVSLLTYGGLYAKEAGLLVQNIGRMSEGLVAMQVSAALVHNCSTSHTSHHTLHATLQSWDIVVFSGPSESVLHRHWPSSYSEEQPHRYPKDKRVTIDDQTADLQNRTKLRVRGVPVQLGYPPSFKASRPVPPV